MFRKIKLVNNVELLLNIYNPEERKERGEERHFINDTLWLLRFPSDFLVFFSFLSDEYFSRRNFLLLLRFPSDIFIFIPFWIRVERLFIEKYVKFCAMIQLRGKALWVNAKSALWIPWMRRIFPVNESNVITESFVKTSCFGGRTGQRKRL